MECKRLSIRFVTRCLVHLPAVTGITVMAVLLLLVGSKSHTPRNYAQLPPAAKEQLGNLARDTARRVSDYMGITGHDAALFGQEAETRSLTDEDLENLTVACTKLASDFAELDNSIQCVFDNILRECGDAGMTIQASDLLRHIHKTLAALDLASLQNRSDRSGKMSMNNDRRMIVLLTLIALHAQSPSALDAIQSAMERTVDNLLTVRAKVTNPKAKQAIDRAILALRRVGRLFDTKPPTITVNILPPKAPDPVLGKPVYTAADFSSGVRVRMTIIDTLSGPDATSLTLAAAVNGSTFNLSPAVTIVSNDPVQGSLVAEAPISATSIPDATNIVFTCTAKDHASNQGTGVSIAIAKATGAPKIEVLSPIPEGNTTAYHASPDAPVPLRIVIMDSAGFTSSGVSITIDGSEQFPEVVFTSPQTVKLYQKVVFLPVNQNYMLVVKVSNVSGASSSASVAFTTNMLELQTRRLLIDLVDFRQVPPILGGLPNRLSPPIRVRVTSEGFPVAGVRVRPFVLTSTAGEDDDSGGILSPEFVFNRLTGPQVGENLSTITDASGMAAFFFQFPRKPFDKSAVQIEVDRLDGVTENPRTLEFQSIPPDLESSISLVTPLAPPTSFGGEDFPTIFSGGAAGFSLSNLPASTNVRIEEVVSVGETPRANPIPGNVALTDASGNLLVPFAISPTASTGKITFKVSLPEFRNADGSVITATRSMFVNTDNIIPPSALRRAEIKAGQGQRLLRDQQSNPITVQIRPDDDPSSTDVVLVNPGGAAEVLALTAEGFTVKPTEIAGTFAVPINGSNQAKFLLKPVVNHSFFVEINAGTITTDSGGNVTSTSVFAPNELLAVGRPEVYFVRKNFQKDAAGKIVRDPTTGQGTPIGGFERIKVVDFFDEEPSELFRADVLTPSGQTQAPKNIYWYFIETRLSKKADAAIFGAVRLNYAEELLGPAISNFDLATASLELVEEGEEFVYRTKDGFVWTMLDQKQFNVKIAGPITANDGTGDTNLHVMSTAIRNQTSPWVTTQAPPTEEAHVVAKGAGYVVQQPMWYFVGDSITNGVMHLTVAEDTQLDAYPAVAGRSSNIFIAQALISEPGMQPRFFFNPGTPPDKVTQEVGKPLDPNTPGLPIARLEYFKLMLSPGRSPGVRWVNNFAIDGFETRDAALLGSKGRFFRGDLDFESEYTRDFGAFGKQGTLESDFMLARDAGMEVEDFFSSDFKFASTEYFLMKEILQDKSEIGKLTFLKHFPKRRPNLIVYWLGNNDSLESFYGGLTISAKFTPFDEFNTANHKAELAALQELRRKGSCNSGLIPTLKPDKIDKALNIYLNNISVPDPLNSGANLSILTMKGGLFFNLRAIRDAFPDTDLVVVPLPDTPVLPLGIKMTSGSFRKYLEDRKDKLSFAIEIAGNPITDNVLDIPISRKIRNDQGDVTDELHHPESTISYVTLLGRSETAGDDLVVGLKAFAPAFILERLLFPKQVSLNWLFERPFALMGELARAGVGEPFALVYSAFVAGRERFKSQVDVNIDLFKGGLKEPFVFREDEVLSKVEQDSIRLRIATFNTVIKDASTTAPFNFHRLQSVIDALNTSLDPDNTGAGFDVVKEGATVARLRARISGGVFSLDGVHPGPFAHALVADELITLMRKEAEKRPDRTFGGVHASELPGLNKAALETIKKKDPVLGEE